MMRDEKKVIELIRAAREVEVDSTPTGGGRCYWVTAHLIEDLRSALAALDGGE